MKKLYLCLACIATMLFISSPATTQVQNVTLAGKRLVFDETNLIYWYPHMNDMVHMTKYKQQKFIKYALNKRRYAKQRDWHMANLDQLINLCFSLSQDAVPTGFGPPGAESFSPVNPLQFFDATNYYGAPTSNSPLVITGRTVDEWAAREDLDGSVDIRWGEGEYHLPYLPVLPVPPGFVDAVVFDYDLNWVSDRFKASDRTPVAPVPLGYPGVDPEQSWFECSAWTIVEAVKVDIKPFTRHNGINMKSTRKVPVAILTTSVADGELIDFDATKLDPKGIKFGPAKASIADSKGYLMDVDHDGDKDLVVRFRISETGIRMNANQASVFIEMDGHTLVFTDIVLPYGYPKTKNNLKSTAVEEEELTFSAENYPNPFSHETEIRFEMPEDSHVLLTVYNIQGQEIQVLVNSPYVAGMHSIRWGGKDMSGNDVPGGIYIYRIQVGNNVQVNRMMLVR